MKKTAILLFSFIALSLAIGCKPSSQKGSGNNDDSDSTSVSAENEEADTTMYGEYISGGHGGFMLKCEDDSTREFVIDIDNDSNVVKGGAADGDQMAVTFITNGLGERVATNVIDLTTLQATWASLDRNFEIQKGGTVQSHQQGETKPWTSWRIFNGRLVLNRDTFDIDRLDGDSLLLEDRDGIYAYSRVIKK